MPREKGHKGLIPKKVREVVHDSKGNTFSRYTTVWVKPEKTDKARIKAKKIAGTTQAVAWENKFNNLGKDELKHLKNTLKNRLIELNKRLLHGNLSKDEIEGLKDIKKRIRAKRALLKRVLKHKKEIRKTDKQDYSDFTIKREEPIRERFNKLISSDNICKFLTKEKVKSFLILHDYTDPEKITFDDGRKAVFKPKKNERKLRVGVPVGTYYLREVCSYEIDKILGFGFVPPTSFKIYDHRVGSAQMWVDGTKGSELTSKPFLRKDMGIKVGLFDCLTGNTDRHDNNWLYDGKKIWLIDNGLNFDEVNRARIRSIFVRENRDITIPEEYLDLIHKKKKEILSCVKDYLGNNAVSATEYRINKLLSTKKMLEPTGW